LLQTRAVSDAGDPEELATYFGSLLRALGRIAPDETPQMQPLSGGVSCRTVLVRRAAGETWVVKQALAKLSVAADWFADPRRIHREAAGLRWLGSLLPPGTVPAFVFEDEATHLLAMEAVAAPHENLKTVLLEGRVERALIAAFGNLLGTVHRVGRERQAALRPVFEDRQFFESLRIEPYYVFTAAQVAEAAEFLSELVRETRGISETIVHGDFSPKNILVHAGRLVLLDHEVIHFGDGAFDVGFALTHLLSKAHHLPAARGAFAAAALAFWQAYGREAGPARAHEPRAVRHTLGCLLARVAGRSPLEYLRPEERVRQRAVVVRLMGAPPQTVPDLVDAFVAAVGT
jgi:5-methylthioribose kinase